MQSALNREGLAGFKWLLPNSILLQSPPLGQSSAGLLMVQPSSEPPRPLLLHVGFPCFPLINQLPQKVRLFLFLPAIPYTPSFFLPFSRLSTLLNPFLFRLLCIHSKPHTSGFHRNKKSRCVINMLPQVWSY